MPNLCDKYGIEYRPGTADEAVIEQVIEKRQYSLHEIPLRPAPARPLIVDCGAHIGTATRWFGDQHPDGRVIALEPQEDNFALLQRNTEGIGHVHKNFAAVGCRAGLGSVYDPGEGTWGHRVGAGRDVRIVPLNMIVCRMVGFRPWIVKIDIEGGEGELFSANTEWMDQTPVIMIELHDWMMPGVGDTWRKAAANRREFHRGEVTISVREDWIA
jgi:FkbM family methyltransferase